MSGGEAVGPRVRQGQKPRIGRQDRRQGRKHRAGRQAGAKGAGAGLGPPSAYSQARPKAQSGVSSVLQPEDGTDVGLGIDIRAGVFLLVGDVHKAEIPCLVSVKLLCCPILHRF